MAETIESLRRKIQTAEDLQSVVKTMKALAAVNIRQYEKAVESLSDYYRTIEMGLQVVLQAGVEEPIVAKTGVNNRLAGMVFGSDQGMCGQLNEQVVGHALQVMNDLDVLPEDRTIFAIGARVSGRLEERGQTVEETLTIPSSAAGMTFMVQRLLTKMEESHAISGFDRVFLFYNKPLSGAAYVPDAVHLLPLDQTWLDRLKQKRWPTRTRPLVTTDRDKLLSSCVRQYLFVSLYRALADSLASENASRLASMQNAERNIEDRLEELNTQFRQERQMSITVELLDIVGGFEALTGKHKEC